MMSSRVQALVRSRRQEIAYSLGGFAQSILGTLHGLFSVILFTNVVKINPSYLIGGQVAYAIWNALNDPVFGWMIDHSADTSSRRLPVLKYGGPMWCMTFMGTFYPWSYDGQSYLAAAHYLFSIFCYDGFLTYVLIVKCALFADLCVDSEDRTRLNLYNAWFSLAGSSMATIAYYYWDEENLTPFRTLAFFFCSLSAVAWYASGSLLVMPEHNKYSEPHVLPAVEKSYVEEFWEWFKFAGQLLRQRSFVLYVGMNWMMNFNVSLSGSFFVFLDKYLMVHLMPHRYYILITSLCLYLPKFGIQMLTPVADRLGLYRTILYCTYGLICVGSLSVVAGVEHYFFWGMMVVVQKVLFSSWGFYDLVMADIIDEDSVLHNRKESVATSVHGVQSLLVKPSSSFAAMFGVYLLSSNGLQEKGSSTAPTSGLQEAVYLLTFLVPLAFTFFQLVIWSQFDLTGRKLQNIKGKLKENQRGGADV
uniref:Uncharacterized protein n=1 Tax=Mucochytrium quahogii TaxID=96639 RepID=A0A7S2RVJ6_9STRA|mmetsp:Transcript_7646/g.12375  ORF Transcript_7646/g.12375 Transcript_7646/m.12375 type:complete len:475 (+) Transcript_7646:833-2257(+)